MKDGAWLLVVGLLIGLLPWLLTRHLHSELPIPTPTVTASTSPSSTPAEATPTPTETAIPAREEKPALTFFDLRPDYSVKPKGMVRALGFCNKDMLISLTNDGNLDGWDLTEKGPSRRWGRFTEGEELSVSADHSRVAVTAPDFVDIIDANDGTFWARIDRNSLSLAGLSGDGKMLAVGTDLGTVELYDLSGSEPKRTRTLDDVGLPKICISHFAPAAGRLVVLGRDDSDQLRVVVYRVSDWKRLLSFGHSFGPPRTLSLAEDGRLLALGLEEGKIEIWDSWTGEKIQSLIHKGAYNATVSLSPNGRVLASTGNSHLGVWDVKSGKLLRDVKLKDTKSTGMSVAWSPSALALGTSTGEIRMWWVDH